jgi:hypothetical protein
MTDKPAPAPAPKAALEPVDDGKVKVRTTGQFMLLDPFTSEEIDPGEAKRMTRSPFVERRLAIGDLEIVK